MNGNYPKSKIPVFLERRWWERPYVDLWTVPHILMGVLIAAAVMYWLEDAWLGLLIVVVTAFVWEVFEHVTGISKNVEPLSNRISDILAGMVGYGLGLTVFRFLPNGQVLKSVIIAVISVDILFTVLGILSYRMSIRK